MKMNCSNYEKSFLVNREQPHSLKTNTDTREEFSMVIGLS